MVCIKALKKFQVRVAGCHKFLPPREGLKNTFRRWKIFLQCFWSTIVWHSLHEELALSNTIFRVLSGCSWYSQIPAQSADKRDLVLYYKQLTTTSTRTAKQQFFVHFFAVVARATWPAAAGILFRNKRENPRNELVCFFLHCRSFSVASISHFLTAPLFFFWSLALALSLISTSV